MHGLLPPAASAHAADIDFVLMLVHALMFVLFAGWIAYFGWVLIRFRQKRQPQANHDGAKGRVAFWVEVGVVVAEAVLLVGIALPLWFQRTAAPPAGTHPIVVRVIAEQFAWHIVYPGPDGEFGTMSPALIDPANPVGLDRKSPHGADDILTLNAMHLPIDRPVIVQLSSMDVIHSFGVPAMRVKQDAIPGLYAPVYFTPTLGGVFDIACSQLCGIGHYRMYAQLTVDSDAAFAKFLADAAARQ
jgi:cytochrome c oxidase subunit II